MAERIAAQMREINIEWLSRAAEFGHLFQMRWLGERFFHLPGDMQAIQDLVWQIRPEVIVQTGIAAGGGPVFSASMLALAGETGHVIAIDPKVRPEVRERLAAHPLQARIQIIEGESCADTTLQQVREQIAVRGPVLVILDLTHTHAHVLHELRSYAELVTPGSYIIVMDTIMEHLPAAMFEGKPYGHGNNPATAAREFLATDTRFEVDTEIEDRVIMTLSPGGFLKRVR